MSDEREAYTVGRVTFSDDVRRIIRGEMPKIKGTAMSEIEPKKLTIVGAHFDGGVKGWRIVLSDGSILDGIRVCEVKAAHNDITQIDLSTYVHNPK